MRGATSPLSQYTFMAWFSVKHRDNFTSLHLLLYMQYSQVEEAKKKSYTSRGRKYVS